MSGVCVFLGIHLDLFVFGAAIYFLVIIRELLVSFCGSSTLGQSPRKQPGVYFISMPCPSPGRDR